MDDNDKVTKTVSDGAQAVADVREMGRRLASGEWWGVPVCSPQGAALWNEIAEKAKRPHELTYLRNPEGPVVAIGMIRKADFPKEALAGLGRETADDLDGVLILTDDAPDEVVRWIVHQLGLAMD